MLNLRRYIPPQIVKEYSKWFNKKDYEYWGITIDK